MTPSGVQGKMRPRFCRISPWLSGWKASTSFCGEMRSMMPQGSIGRGSGICTRMAWIRGSAVLGVDDADDLLGGRLFRQLDELGADAELFGQFAFRLHVGARSGIVAGHDHDQARARRRVRSSAARSPARPPAGSFRRPVFRPKWPCTPPFHDTGKRKIKPASIEQVRNQAVLELGLEPGRLGRHDLAGIGHGEQLLRWWWRGTRRRRRSCRRRPSSPAHSCRGCRRRSRCACRCADRGCRARGRAGCSAGWRHRARRWRRPWSKVPGLARRRYQLPARYMENSWGRAGTFSGDSSQVKRSETRARKSAGPMPFRSLTTRL